MSWCTVGSLGPTDPRYVFGVDCTWHGSVRGAGERRERVDTTSYGDAEPSFHDATVPACPHCGDNLNELPNEHQFWQMVAAQDRKHPGTEAMLRWATGRHFDTFDELQSAWRQAMEGQS